MHDETHELEKKRVEVMEKMHKEKMDMFRQFLDVLACHTF